MSLVRSKNSRGFSLIELLIVLVVVGILMAITIPAMLNALDKGRQKRTMADIRFVGSSIETYAVDNSTYPVGTSINDLLDLTPEYMDTLLVVDAWDHELVYTATATEYTLGSAGKNGGSTLTLVAGGGPTNNFDDDIVFRLGNFVQWPEGTQE